MPFLNRRFCVQDYLQDFRESLDLKPSDDSVSFVSVNKDSHVLEVPDKLAKNVPEDFEAKAAKKGCKRYSSSELQVLVAERKAALDAVEAAQNDILRVLVARFAEDKAMWLQVLMSNCCYYCSATPLANALARTNAMQNVKKFFP
jgi:DNA mismatch repair ATPase MutS